MNRDSPTSLVLTTAEEPQDIGEASVEPALSLDILALDGGDQKQKQNNGLSGSKSTADGHNSSLDFILTIGSSDSVTSTVTIDPTIHIFDEDAIALNDEPSSTSASTTVIPTDIPQSNSNESKGGKRRFKLPANANRWMDDSEHPKSVCSRTSYMGILGLTNHLVPIQDEDDDDENHDGKNGGRHNKFHNSKNSSYSELISNDSSAFEAGSFSTCESFAYNDEPSPNPKSKNHLQRPNSKGDNLQKSPGKMMGLSLKMQQLKGVGSLPLDDNDDDMDDLGDDALRYDPSGPRPAYLDSVHSLNTLISLDNFQCNTTDHTTTSFGSADS